MRNAQHNTSPGKENILSLSWPYYLIKRNIENRQRVVKLKTEYCDRNFLQFVCNNEHFSNLIWQLVYLLYLLFYPDFYIAFHNSCGIFFPRLLFVGFASLSSNLNPKRFQAAAPFSKDHSQKLYTELCHLLQCKLPLCMVCFDWIVLEFCPMKLLVSDFLIIQEHQSPCLICGK